MAKILYVYNDQVYANITNKCDCNCTFCIRKQFDGVGDADTLWHKAEPSLSEIIAAIDAFDFTRNSCATGTGFPKEIVASFNSNVFPMVNGIRLWPYSNPDSSASSFTLYGSADAGSTWIPIFHPVSQSFSSMTWKQFVSIADPAFYKSLKLEVEATHSTGMALYEVQFLICNDVASTLEYPETSYSLFARYDSIDAHVGTFGITSCQSSPTLPAGITIDQQCTISGRPTAAAPQTVYTITGTSGSKTVSGTITLTVTDCQGMLLRIVRTSRTLPRRRSIFVTAPTTLF